MSEHTLMCDSSEISLCSDVQSYIDEVYPEFSEVDFLEEKKEIISKSEIVCKNMHAIYFDREKYELHWAFKQAQQCIIVRQEKIGQKLRDRIPNYQKILSNTNSRTRLKVKRIRNTFNTLSFFISFIDIVISVSLILLVTILSQKIESHIESIVLNIVFIGLIALGKVILDRFLILPGIRKWGWKQFLKAITLMKQISVRLIVINIVIEAAIKREMKQEEIIELFLRGFDQKKFSTRINKEHLEKLTRMYQKTHPSEMKP